MQTRPGLLGCPPSGASCAAFASGFHGSSLAFRVSFHDACIAIKPASARQRRTACAALPTVMAVATLHKDMLQSPTPQSPLLNLSSGSMDDPAERLWYERLGTSAAAGVCACMEDEQRLADAQDALSRNPWAPQPHHVGQEQLWQCIQSEARALCVDEPEVASKLHMSVLMHPTFERAMAFLLASKLACETLLPTQLTRLILEVYQDDPGILESAAADLQAVKDRDFACQSHVQCLVFFKGFQAIQSQRVAHWLWQRGRHSLALALKSRISEAFSVDVHPGASIGRGVMLDHATGIVIGGSAVIGDNVSMLHHVTLGGSGTGHGSMHPVIGNGVLLGTGVSVLGPVVVGANCKVGTGSLVVTSLPPNAVAVGSPAKVVRYLEDFSEPLEEMDQVSGFILDFEI